MSDFPFLLVMVAVPAVGAAVVAALPRGRDLLAKQVALGVSLVVLVLAVLATVAFDPDGARFQLTTSVSWIAAFGVRFAFGVDGIALVMLLLVGVLVPVVSAPSWTTTIPGPLDAGLLRLAAAARGDDGRRLRRHRRLPVLRLLRGDARPDVLPDRQLRRPAPAVRGGEVLPVQPGRRPDHARRRHRAVRGEQQPARRTGTFAFDALRQLESTPGVQKLLFLGFFIAFAIKAPLVPFHTWLPDAGSEAPIGGAVLLVGVLDKVGTFGFLRYCLPLFPDASRRSRRGLVLAVVGILYAALLAMGQSDMKRLVVLHVDLALRLHRARASSRSPPRPAPARCSTWSTTASRPGCCSSSSAC